MTLHVFPCANDGGRARRVSVRAAARPLPVLVAVALVLSVTAGSAYAQQGSCFVWNNNGANACVSGVTEAQCNALAGWSGHYFIAGGSCDNGLPVKQEPDIRWRYVMVVDDCKIEGNECKEHHKLFRCGSDATHH